MPQRAVRRAVEAFVVTAQADSVRATPVVRGVFESAGGVHGVEDPAAEDEPEFDGDDQQQPNGARRHEGQTERPERAHRPRHDEDPMPAEPGDERSGQP